MFIPKAFLLGKIFSVKREGGSPERTSSSSSSSNEEELEEELMPPLKRQKFNDDYMEEDKQWTGEMFNKEMASTEKKQETTDAKIDLKMDLIENNSDLKHLFEAYKEIIADCEQIRSQKNENTQEQQKQRLSLHNKNQGRALT